MKKKKAKPPLPGGGMKREKTVVEKAADISDSKKQEMIKMMMREQTSMAMKINKEQTRQEELVCTIRQNEVLWTLLPYIGQKNVGLIFR